METTEDNVVLCFFVLLIMYTIQTWCVCALSEKGGETNYSRRINIADIDIHLSKRATDFSLTFGVWTSPKEYACGFTTIFAVNAVSTHKHQLYIAMYVCSYYFVHFFSKNIQLIYFNYCFYTIFIIFKHNYLILFCFQLKNVVRWLTQFVFASSDGLWEGDVHTIHTVKWAIFRRWWNSQNVYIK